MLGSTIVLVVTGSLVLSNDFIELISGETILDTMFFKVSVMLLKSILVTLSFSISAEEIYNEWSFDVLNPLIDLDSDVYDIEGLTSAAIRLVAIRNGIAPEVVQSWDLE